jgi:phosphoribosylformylglycinamidine synthase
LPHRIEVVSDVINAEGEGIKKRVLNDLGISLDSVRTVTAYNIDADLPLPELEKLGQELFSDRVTEKYSTDSHLADGIDFNWLIEKGFRPGVTDDVGKTSEDGIKDILGKDVKVYASKQYLLSGKLKRDEVKAIASLLTKTVVEQYKYRSSRQWQRNPLGVYMPVVKLVKPKLGTFDFNVSDGEIMEIITNNGLALNLEGTKIFMEYFNNLKIMEERRRLGLPDKPTDVETQCFAQTNCDHCKHTTFNGMYEYNDGDRREMIDSLLKTYIKASTEEIRRRLGRKDWLVSVFSDNSGVVVLDKDYNVLFKVETHNMPSALDPEPGADTGTAVVRDLLGTGKGGRPIYYSDILCFGNPSLADRLPHNILHPKRVTEGVRTGIEHGGNRKGIPVVNGTVRFDSYPFGTITRDGVIQTYVRPLVYCGCGAIMPAMINNEPSHIKKADPGDLFIKIGGRTGADGIHGATISSGGLNPKSPIRSVQMASALTEKKNIDFVVEARDLALYKSVTDNGAGGLSCSGDEMALESGGLDMDLTNLPLKYQGLQDWEKLLSEAQEIMVFAVHPDKSQQFLDLAERRGVEATVLGRFTDSGYFNVYDSGRMVAHLDLNFLHRGLPQRHFEARWSQPKYEEPSFKQPDLDWALNRMLSRLNICSKEYFVRQYDHEVQASTVVKPLTGVKNDGPSDGAVLWPLELQKKGSRRGIVVANGINANYGLIDTYHMAASNIDEAIRNAVASGANPDRIALLDNFCWSSPEDEYRAAQLVRACKACYDYSIEFLTPFISGKDSMHNESVGNLDGKLMRIEVMPTLLIASLGMIHDINNSMTMDAKQPDSLIYVLGATNDETGGSEYYAMMGSEFNQAWVGNKVPKVNAASAKKLYRALYRAIQDGIVYSCHDCSDGGLGVALAEMAFAGGYGMKINLEKVPTPLKRDDHILFSESNSRFIVEVPQDRAYEFEKTMKGNIYAQVGIVSKKGRFNVYGLNGKQIMYEKIDDLKESWQKTLRW